MITKETTLKNVADLAQHPFNQVIYGALKFDAQLIESIQQKGVLTPIVINKKNQILSGSRRWLAARNAGLPKIPAHVWTPDGDNQEAEQQAYLIEANRQRIKTKAQLAKEVAALFRIAEEDAARRMKAGKKADPRTNSSTGRSRDEVGKKAGVSGPTAQKLRDIAKHPKAMAALESGMSVDRAHRAIKKKRKGTPKVSAVKKEAKDLQRIMRNRYKGSDVWSRKGKFHVSIFNLVSQQVRRIAGKR